MRLNGIQCDQCKRQHLFPLTTVYLDEMVYWAINDLKKIASLEDVINASEGCQFVSMRGDACN